MRIYLKIRERSIYKADIFVERNEVSFNWTKVGVSSADSSSILPIESIVREKVELTSALKSEEPYVITSLLNLETKKPAIIPLVIGFIEFPAIYSFDTSLRRSKNVKASSTGEYKVEVMTTDLGFTIAIYPVYGTFSSKKIFEEQFCQFYKRIRPLISYLEDAYAFLKLISDNRVTPFDFVRALGAGVMPTVILKLADSFRQGKAYRPVYASIFERSARIENKIGGAGSELFDLIADATKIIEIPCKGALYYKKQNKREYFRYLEEISDKAGLRFRFDTIWTKE